MPKSRHNKTKRGTSRQRSAIHTQKQLESDSEMAGLLLLLLLARGGDDEAKSLVEELASRGEDMRSKVDAFNKVLDLNGHAFKAVLTQ